MTLFVALVEVGVSESCRFELEGAVGAYVRCYVLAATRSEAIAKITEQLDKDGLPLGAVEWCVDESTTEWSKEGSPEAAFCAHAARETKGVVYSEFNTWEADEDHQGEDR